MWKKIIAASIAEFFGIFFMTLVSISMACNRDGNDLAPVITGLTVAVVIMAFGPVRSVMKLINPYRIFIFCFTPSVSVCKCECLKVLVCESVGVCKCGFL